MDTITIINAKTIKMVSLVKVDLAMVLQFFPTTTMLSLALGQEEDLLLQGWLSQATKSC
jgi:hypothetical protein